MLLYYLGNNEFLNNGQPIDGPTAKQIRCWWTDIAVLVVLTFVSACLCLGCVVFYSCQVDGKQWMHASYICSNSKNEEIMEHWFHIPCRIRRGGRRLRNGPPLQGIAPPCYTRMGNNPHRTTAHKHALGCSRQLPKTCPVSAPLEVYWYTVQFYKRRTDILEFYRGYYRVTRIEWYDRETV